MGILPYLPRCALRAPGVASGGGGMADALVSGASDRKVVEVQLLSAAPPSGQVVGRGLVAIR